jgi:hypothetical protein
MLGAAKIHFTADKGGSNIIQYIRSGHLDRLTGDMEMSEDQIEDVGKGVDKRVWLLRCKNAPPKF